MSRGDTRWIVAGSLVALTGLGMLALRHRDGARRASALEEATVERSRGDVAGPLERSGAFNGTAPEATSPQVVERDVDATMARWRTAVLVKDAQAVVALDQVFRQLPDRFADALAGSAETDGNERVRAFSTRVLGKLRRPELAPLYGRLLADRSVFVRQNAAWALGELGGVQDGRAAAAGALAELRQVGARDPANEVRLAARDALGKLD
jgi:HEAT repeat protein